MKCFNSNKKKMMKMRRALKSFKQLKGRSQVFQMYLIAVRIQISSLIADRK